MAPNLGCLIFFRVLQGLAGGALLPTSQTLIQEQFPREKAGMAMAIFGMSVMVGPALGPTLGGYLTDHFGWRSIFNINVPLGIIAAILSWANVYDMKGSAELAEKAKKSGVDWTGIILLCIGVGCFQYILERGEAEQWFESTLIRTCAVFATVGISSFIYWELKVPNPVMNLRLFKSNIVRSGTALMLMLGIMLYAVNFVVPIYVSTVIPNMSATQTGMLFMPGSIATAIFMLPVGNLLRFVNAKFLVLIGIFFASMSVFSMTQFTALSSPNAILVPLILRGIAAAFLFVPINQMVLGSFAGPELGQVAGMQNFFRQIGGSIGISSLDTLITRFSAQHYNDMMAKVNALNPTAYQTYVQGTGMATAKLGSSIGLWNPNTLAVKALHGRVLLQVFIMSFEQLCWVIIGIVACGVIPLYFIKYKRNNAAKPIMDSH